jgi:hypothetical protein
MYLFIRGINFASFYDLHIELRNCSDNLTIFCFFNLFTKRGDLGTQTRLTQPLSIEVSVPNRENEKPCICHWNCGNFILLCFCILLFRAMEKMYVIQQC